MLDGIDYYPKKKKRIFGKLVLLLLFLLALIGLWYYLQSMDLSQSKTSSIIISQPSDIIENENKNIEVSKEEITPKVIETNEAGLDEVVSNYEANTQN